MNIKHEQFIGIYENAFSKEYCDAVIQYYENMASAGFTLNRQQQDKAEKISKEDEFVFGTYEHIISLYESQNLVNEFNTTLWTKCYPVYANEFWALKNIAQHNSYSFKIQKTQPGQGYHVWHCEKDSKFNCNRILAWTLYLNDVEDGGETEFIYQHIRVKPKQGTFVIFPSGFTHTHRGNPPLTNDKYILTGWIEF